MSYARIPIGNGRIATVETFGVNLDGRLEYMVNGEFHYSKMYYYAWAKGLHGNPPSGAPYRYAILRLPNGKTARYREYI